MLQLKEAIEFQALALKYRYRDPDLARCPDAHKVYADLLVANAADKREAISHACVGGLLHFKAAGGTVTNVADNIARLVVRWGDGAWQWPTPADIVRTVEAVEGVTYSTPISHWYSSYEEQSIRLARIEQLILKQLGWAAA
jgi:hypothetical protein